MVGGGGKDVGGRGKEVEGKKRCAKKESPNRRERKKGKIMGERGRSKCVKIVDLSDEQLEGVMREKKKTK